MFEDSKAWIFLLLTAVLVGSGFGAHYFSAVDEANLALQESKTKLKEIKELLVVRQKEWQDREVALAKIQAETNNNTALAKTQEQLIIRYQKVDSDLKYLVESMKSSVEKVRAQAPGTELGDVTLASGKILKNAKIRKMEETGISMIHGDGIGTIPLDELPENLKEKYDLGPKALLPVIQQAQITFQTKEGVSPARPAAPSPTPEPPKKSTVSVDDSRVKGIKYRIAEIDAQISNYSTVLNQYQTAAASHQSLASNAVSRGTPSTRHTENANDNLAQAAAVQRQINSLQAERRKLNIELEHALKPQ